jgi:hypothetical protein
MEVASTSGQPKGMPRGLVIAVETPSRKRQADDGRRKAVFLDKPRLPP